MSVITHIISDLDGTLVDTFEANCAAYQEVFAEYGYALSRETYRGAFGLRLDAFLAQLENGKFLERQTEIKAKKAACYPRHFDKLVLNQPLVEFYRMFRLPGGHLALASTASAKNIQGVLEAVKCTDLFDFCITGEMVPHGKPAPDCYALAVQKWGVPAENVLVFEDSDIGIQAAENAGLKAIRVGEICVHK